MLVWHFVIFNLSAPYEGGVFLGKILLPMEYPLKPPHIQLVTPNGRFQPDENICMSFTKYHPESWSPMWSIANMLQGLVSFFQETTNTAGAIQTTTGQKMQYAH